MAFNNNEQVSITLTIQGDQARNQLNLLETEARQLERALKEAPKGTKEWADLYKEIGRNADAQKALREQVGLSGLTLNQLEKEAKSIVREMKDMTAGTEEYAAKSARLKEVNARIGELRQDYKALLPEIENVTASVADWDDENKRATLTVKQLREVSAALADEIQDLVPGTKEHTAAVEKQTEVNKQLNTTARQVTATIADWDDENKRATLTVKQLREVSRQLADEIEQLVPGTKEHAAAVEKQTDVNKQLNTTLEQQPSRWKRIQDTVVSLVGAFSLMSIIEEVFSFFKEGITDALKLTDAMGGVEKSTGLSTQQVKELAGELDKIDTRTTKEDLMTIAQIGGQLGVANEELLGFVKSVDMAAVALGDEFSGGAEEAAKEIGSLQKLFKETRDMKAGDAINDIGSALNELGASGSATAPVVADFTQRIGQLGDLSPEISQTLGLGAAFEELGLTAEVSASGLSSILLTAAKDTGTFAQQLKISEDQMKKLINTNPNEFLLKLGESFKNVPADQLATRLYDLGIRGDGATKVMALLKDQTDLVRQKQEIAANAMKGVYNAALEQVGKSTDTFAKKLGLSKDELEKLIKSNPNEFFIRLANSFKGLSETQIAEEMKKLGFNSAEATKLVSDLSKATNRQAQEQLLANPAIKQATSLQEEFNKMNTTAAAEVDKAKKGIKALAVDAGGVLIPMLQKGVAGFIAFVDIIRAVPGFLDENKETIGLLTLALLTFNSQMILATSATLAKAAADKVSIIWTTASDTAWKYLNTTMSANPIGAVITVILLMAAGLMALYNNSITVRAGVNGLFEAMKVATTELGRMWEALKSLNFAEATTIMMEGGKKIAAGFTKGYNDKLAEEAPKQLATHKKLVDDKKTASVQGAQQTGQLEALESQKALDQKAKQANDARQQEAQEAKKDTEETYKKRRDAQIEAIKDETERERAKLQWKHEQEVAAVQASKASEANKNLAIKALDAQLKTELEAVNLKHLDKVRADQARALELQRELQLSLETDEKRRAELDAQFKYEKERDRIQKEIADERTKQQLLAQLHQQYVGQQEQINAEFRRKEQEAQAFIRQTDQAATLALLDFKELMAKTKMANLVGQERGTSQEILTIQKERINKEFEFFRINLRAQRDEELQRIEESKLTEDQKAKAKLAIETKYLADVKVANAQHDAQLLEKEKEALEKRRALRETFSSAFAALLAGDVAGFQRVSEQFYSIDKETWKKLLTDRTEAIKLAADVAGQIATAAVNFQNKLTQQRIETELAALKKETEEKKALLDKELADKKTSIEQSEQQIKDTKAQYSDQVRAIKQQEQEQISSLEQLYRDLQSSESQAAFDAEVQRTNRLRDEKIEAAKQARDEAIDAAQNEREEKIIAAEATRDAEIASIRQRADYDKQTKDRLIAESQKKFEQEKKLAEDEADIKIKLAKKEADTKVATAKDEAIKKLKLMDQLKTADEDKAKELIALAKDEAKQKVATAEQEKRDKLKIAEAEKATRIQQKKELETNIDKLNQESLAKQKDLNRQKWEADKKAQISTAIIAGSVAAVKALASGFFPVNLGFAAIIAGLTIAQVAMIRNQPAPAFRDGGMGQVTGSDGGTYGDYVGSSGPSFANGGRSGSGRSTSHFRNAGLLRGGRHGNRYGERGIAMIDRRSGQEVGEAEDGEPFMILSRNTYSNNKGVVDKLLHTSLYRNGQKIKYDNGGIGSAGQDEMVMDGGGSSGESTSSGSEDVNVYSGPSSAAEGDANGVGEATAALGDAEVARQEAVKMGLDQLRLLQENIDAIKAMNKDMGLGLATLDKDVVVALDALTSSNKAELGDVRATLKQELADLRATLKEELGALATVTKTSLGSLENTTRTSLAELATSNEQALDSLETTTKQELGNLATSNKESLGSLETTTKSSLSELAASNKESLGSLETTTRQELGSLAATNKESLDGMAGQVGGLKGSINGVENAVRSVEGATRGVEGAVYGTNQAGRLDQLVSVISQMK